MYFEHSNSDTISSFDEEYRYHRSIGLSHFEALNKARDYYRRYLRREVTESDTMSLGQFEDETSYSAEHIVDFNIIIANILNAEYGREKLRAFGKKEKLVKLTFLVVRLEGLDHILTEEHLGMSYDLIGDIQVGSMAEIAIAMGYKVKANGCSNALTELKYGLQNLIREFGLVKEENGHVAFA